MNLSILNGFSRITPQDMDQTIVEMQSRKSSPGWSRYYDGNEPHREGLNGFSRVVFSPKELQGLTLQGLTLQGQTILQGYSMGDLQDLDEWSYLVDIEHPVVLNGFPAFVLNGKRKAKKEARKAKKQAEKTAKTQKKQKKETRKAEQKLKKKALKTAKKEEKLLKKSQDAAAKRLRKQTRAEKGIRKRQEREISKRLKTQMKGERGGRFAEIFGQAVPDVVSDVAELVRGRGDFSDFSTGELQIPDQLQDFISSSQMMDPEEVLDQREELIDETEGMIEEEDMPGGADNKKALKASNTGLLILGAAAVAALALSKPKKKKRA